MGTKRVQMVMPTPKEKEGAKKPTGIQAPPQWNLIKNTKVRLMEISSRYVTFAAPAEENDQKVMAPIKSIANSPIAFKIKADHPHLYATKPSKGVIEPGGTVEIEYVMRKRPSSEKEVQQEPQKRHHHFLIEGIDWPKDQPTFDQNVWTEMLDIGVDVHKLVLRIQVGGDEVSESAASGAEAQISPAAAETLNFVTTEHTKIQFKAPFGQKQTQAMCLTNQYGGPCAFKVKTNKPTFYGVKPAKGLMKPGSTVSLDFEVTDTFTDEEYAKAVPGSHKFQLQAVAWPEDEEKRFDSKVFDAQKSRGMQTFTIDIEHQDA